MATSTDVNLPRTCTPQFPDRCVVCGCQNPNSHVRLLTGSIGWWTVVFWTWGKFFIAKAPSCFGCAWMLHGLRFISLLMTLTTISIAIWFIWPHIKESVPPGIHKPAILVLALLCLLPKVIFEVFFPMPFDMTVFADSVDYEFKSKDYAVEFAVLNIDAEWVKVDDQVINKSGGE